MLVIAQKIAIAKNAITISIPSITTDKINAAPTTSSTGAADRILLQWNALNITLATHTSAQIGK